ncbi:family 16 glycosylhydrolase [Granulosicoccus sp.]|nr:family 16 glycosylhydrolase [Granulosicoccus sp.]
MINLDRQPVRWRRIQHELGRFATHDGTPLTHLATRMSAIDARDGRETAATADVDTVYRMGDQLFVEPDDRLEECFGIEEPIRMTRQEIAVARSHIEVWKVIAEGEEPHVLVLEDDVWFAEGAAVMIDRGWCAALAAERAIPPQLLYFSYKDAGGTAEREDVRDALFRPVRGLWYFSGYVLSKEGAAALLRAMPVVGPVDLWINHQFAKLSVMALSKPAILQREDGGSDNAYSILPYLARAGIVDAESAQLSPPNAAIGPVFAWSAIDDTEDLAMALSMLGLRVRSFYCTDDEPFDLNTLASSSEPFDAFVNPPFNIASFAAAIAIPDARFLFTEKAQHGRPESLPIDRTLLLREYASGGDPWRELCSFLGVTHPNTSYPRAVPKDWRMFKDDRPARKGSLSILQTYKKLELDESPWVLPANVGWVPREIVTSCVDIQISPLPRATFNNSSPEFVTLVETFPGNLASFDQNGLSHCSDGTKLIIRASPNEIRPYQSGAFASVRKFCHGRFEAEIKAAAGAGLVTGFFLHRDAPRQEIDVELLGCDPNFMLVNVYFNPGDDGAAIGYGYRGSPCKIDLGFDATLDFHTYAIDWVPERIRWSVDGRVVHERMSWDPTPIPHLPMRLHANLWAPRSEELAGCLVDTNLPSRAVFRNMAMPISEEPG